VDETSVPGMTVAMATVTMAMVTAFQQSNLMVALAATEMEMTNDSDPQKNGQQQQHQQKWRLL